VPARSIAPVALPLMIHHNVRRGFETGSFSTGGRFRAGSRRGAGRGPVPCAGTGAARSAHERRARGTGHVERGPLRDGRRRRLLLRTGGRGRRHRSSLQRLKREHRRGSGEPVATTSTVRVATAGRHSFAFLVRIAVAGQGVRFFGRPKRTLARPAPASDRPPARLDASRYHVSRSRFSCADRAAPVPGHGTGPSLPLVSSQFGAARGRSPSFPAVAVAEF
jgi:hypothetical protein